MESTTGDEAIKLVEWGCFILTFFGGQKRIFG
jgi:hypothetical protein